MNTGAKSKKVLRDYLLKIFTGSREQEMEAFEERYFADNDLFLALVEERGNLMLEYAKGRLGRRELELFEQKLAVNASWRLEAAFFTALAACESPWTSLLEKNQNSDETNFGSASLMGMSQ